jgi:hypothetical protein
MTVMPDGHHVCDFDEAAQTCPWAERMRAEWATLSVSLPPGWTRTLEPHFDCAPGVLYDTDSLRSGYHNPVDRRWAWGVHVDAAFDWETDATTFEAAMLRAAMASDSEWLRAFVREHGS